MQVDVDVLHSVLSDSGNDLQKVGRAVHCGTLPRIRRHLGDMVAICFWGCI